MRKPIQYVAAAIAVAAMFAAGTASAQSEKPSTVRLGFGLNVGVPTNSNIADIVIATDLRLQADFSKKVSGTLTTGYDAFLGKPKDANGNKYGSDYIPLKAGAKIFVSNNIYIHPEAGIAFATKSGYGTPFNWSPSVGYANSKGLDLALRYEGFERSNSSGGRFGMVALRVAYGFKL